MNQYDELYHFGVKGMKWGVRRYQNKDGSLSTAGKRKYGVNSVEEWKTTKKSMSKDKRKLTREARRKYNVSAYKFAAQQEVHRNVHNRQLHQELFGTTKFHKESTTFRDEYYDRVDKAKSYIEDKMKKKYGKSYSTWENNNDTKRMIAAGVSFIGSMGIVGVTLYKNSKI